MPSAEPDHHGDDHRGSHADVGHLSVRRRREVGSGGFERSMMVHEFLGAMNMRDCGFCWILLVTMEIDVQGRRRSKHVKIINTADGQTWQIAWKGLKISWRQLRKVAATCV